MLDAQRLFLDELDTWESWERWRQAVLAHYGSQPHWGCPIGALTTELALATFASLHGGPALTQMMESIEPLDAALSAALVALRTAAPLTG